MDDAAKREVINNDYNERREIMDGKPTTVTVAGRMMQKRVMGKASFCNVQDLKGNIQSICGKGQDRRRFLQRFQKMDVGDI